MFFFIIIFFVIWNFVRFLFLYFFNCFYGFCSNSTDFVMDIIRFMESVTQFSFCGRLSGLCDTDHGLLWPFPWKDCCGISRIFSGTTPPWN